MSDLIAIAMVIVAVGLLYSMVALLLTVRKLGVSVECLCSNIDGLRQEMGARHDHA